MGALCNRRGTPCGRPEADHADGEGRHEARPYVVIVWRKVQGDPSTDGPPPGSAFTMRNAGWGNLSRRSRERGIS
jgi:hypothetical protein